jgi:hypothetical protein
VKRIKLIFAVGVVMVAMLALNAGSAMANEIRDVEIDGDDFEIELASGGDLEFDDLEDSEIFGFNFLDLDDDDLDLDFDDDDDDDDVSINEGNDQGVVRVVDFG